MGQLNVGCRWGRPYLLDTSKRTFVRHSSPGSEQYIRRVTVSQPAIRFSAIKKAVDSPRRLWETVNALTYGPADTGL